LPDSGFEDQSAVVPEPLNFRNREPFSFASAPW
jgi:hypothetical protein